MTTNQRKQQRLQTNHKANHVDLITSYAFEIGVKKKQTVISNSYDDFGYLYWRKL